MIIYIFVAMLFGLGLGYFYDVPGLDDQEKKSFAEQMIPACDFCVVSQVPLAVGSVYSPHHLIGNAKKRIDIRALEEVRRGN